MEDIEFPRNPADSATGDLLHLHAPANAVAAADSVGDLFTSDDSYYVDSNCSTPYVSAPSSPGRPFDGGGGGGGGYFYSAPASPMHFMLSTAMSSHSEASEVGACGSGSFEFEFSARYGTSCKDSSAATEEIGSMSSADELFLNGQIRPMKLSTHLQRPQVLAPLMDVAESDENDEYSKRTGDAEGKVLDRNSEDVFRRSRDLRLRDKSIRRRTRSLSPLRDTVPFDWCEVSVKGEQGAEDEHLGQLAKMKAQSNGNGDDKGATDENETASNETTPSASASSSRCSSAGRSSKRWVFLKDFLRSKSEGRSNHKFWTNISFSPAKEKKSTTPQPANNQKEKAAGGESDQSTESTQKPKKSGKEAVKKPPAPAAKPTNGLGKRRVPLSAHELHYTANRAQAEEMRKKTFLPYRQGLLGCLGFSSKSYGAMNGFARALNPVSSR